MRVRRRSFAAVLSLALALAACAASVGTSNPDEGGRDAVTTAETSVDASAPMPVTYADARLVTWSGGGFTGRGVLAELLGDGTFRVWNDVLEAGPDRLPSSTPRTMLVAPARAREVFARWAAAPRAGLPHGTASADVTTSLHVQLCARCEFEHLTFSDVAQVTPELGPFMMAVAELGR